MSYSENSPKGIKKARMSWLYMMDDVGCTIQGSFTEAEEAKFARSKWQIVARADTEVELREAIDLMDKQGSQ